jgi:translation initiation factor IF-3
VPEVRVIGADGSQVGILPTHEALKLAEDAGLELVEVNPRAAPPVCKVMDFGKFKFETSKKEKASRKHQSTIVLKEIKLRPKTDDHDFDFKVKHVRRFLSEGNKCKLVVVFRGREIVHPEMGQIMLDHVVKAVNDLAMVEQRSMMEGRRMVMIIGPRGGIIRAPGAPALPPAGVTGAPSPGRPGGTGSSPPAAGSTPAASGSAVPAAAAPAVAAPAVAAPAAAAPAAAAPAAAAPAAAAPAAAAPAAAAPVAAAPAADNVASKG